MPSLAPISRKKFEKFLIFIGCHHKRTKGDHLIYDRVDLKRPVVFTADREVPTMIIRTNLKTLGMTVEDYLIILNKL
ncbi:MAG: type II toxin-antitoxin system HicA family toxin [Candidatus Woykebacteria bacterium]